MDLIVAEKCGELSGTVNVSSAKNAALPIIAASLLCEEPVTIRDVPAISDVEVLYQMLVCYGAEVLAAPDAVKVSFSQPKECETPYELMRKLRASFLVAGPLLARAGSVSLALPGGCAIGTRPVDLHLKGFKALGANVRIEGGMVHLSSNKKLHGASIYIDYPSVGATENIIMAAVLARGRTVIYNAAAEPEIADLAAFLNAMGAHVRGAGTDTVRIDGVRKLHGGEYRPIPDRIEAGTLLIGTAITGGDVTLRNVRPEHLQPVKAKLIEAGLDIIDGDQSVRIVADKRPKAVDIKAMPYPGFPTDLQAPFMALLCASEGTGMVTETVFENRFMHVPELARMGASIRVEDRSALVEGGKLMGAKVEAHDLRGAAALILAGLVAEGRTQVSGIEHLDRGYVKFEDKLSALGAKIWRETR